MLIKPTKLPFAGDEDSNIKKRTFSVVDLFSGAGGMSYGFHRHADFRLIAAADAEIGKPSMGKGSLQCNSTYAKNMGIVPKGLDLSQVRPDELREKLQLGRTKVDVLSVCPPCTGFSRANPLNHTRDDHRNSLVIKAAEFAIALDADIVVMENARELIRGNFTEHYLAFKACLEQNGYQVHAKTHMLSSFGLPQIRERALIVVAKKHIALKTLDDLWDGWEVSPSATTVKSAFEGISKNASAQDSYPAFSDHVVADRLAAIPHNGGSWLDLVGTPQASKLLTDAMKRIIRLNKLGSHPDVYGRMSWNKPAPTIKRECAHIGNGRYAHPVENRLCSIRELAMLQGFPNEFQFNGNSLSNNYRHIGDAVPPLVSFQIASLCSWMLTGVRPAIHDALLKGTHLKRNQIIKSKQFTLLHAD